MGMSPLLVTEGAVCPPGSYLDSSRRRQPFSTLPICFLQLIHFSQTAASFRRTQPSYTSFSGSHPSFHPVVEFLLCFLLSEYCLLTFYSNVLRFSLQYFALIGISVFLLSLVFNSVERFPLLHQCISVWLLKVIAFLNLGRTR